MAEIRAPSAHDIEIRSVLIETERLNGHSFEIARNVAEINIFEHIDLPFLTGSILLIDTNDIFNKVNFQGTERITLKIKIKDDPRVSLVTKKFVITNIDGIAPIGDTAETISLSILEDHAYLDRLNTVSKAYYGKPEDVIVTVLKDQLKKDVVTPIDIGYNPNWNGSVQPPIKIVTPNISALDTVRWVKNKMTNINGAPFFVFSTLFDDNLVMTDLESLLAKPITNPDKDYLFGQAATRDKTKKTVLEQAYIIQAYKITKSEDMFSLAKKGALNSTYAFIDTSQNQSLDETEVAVHMEEIFEMMKDKNILPKNQRGKIYDDEFEIDGDKIRDLKSSVISSIVTSNSYENYANYYEAADIDEHKLKAISKSLRHYLIKSPIDIILPGWNFLGREEHATVGNQIRLKFLNNDQELHHQTGATAEDIIDKKRSGDYMIYTARHTIKPERYDVSMTVVKLGNLDTTA